MDLPPMAFRPALLLPTMCRAAGDATNGARMDEDAIPTAAACDRAEPQEDTLYVKYAERRSTYRAINGNNEKYNIRVSDCLFSRQSNYLLRVPEFQVCCIGKGTCDYYMCV